MLQFQNKGQQYLYFKIVRHKRPLNPFLYRYVYSLCFKIVPLQLIPSHAFLRITCIYLQFIYFSILSFTVMKIYIVRNDCRQLLLITETVHEKQYIIINCCLIFIHPILFSHATPSFSHCMISVRLFQ